MTENRPEATDEQLEPTIVPVRRPLAEIAGAAAEVGPSRWRAPVIGLAAVIAVAAIVGVFIYLPAVVEEAPDEPEPVVEEVAEPVDTGPTLTAEEIEALNARAEELLADLLEQRQVLDARSAGSWGDTSWSAYETASIQGDEAFLAEDYAEAVAQYEVALATGEELLERSESIVDDALAAAFEAIAGGNAELAASQFELVLEIDPANQTAARGLERSQTLSEVLEIMRRGDDLEQRGELSAAADAYREAAALDAEFLAAGEALRVVNRRIADLEFEGLLTEGFAAVAEGQYERAAEVFTEALSLRPASDAARDGLEQAEQGQLMNQILMAEIRGSAFERRELWDQAIERYEEALEADPTLRFAIDGLARSQARADLDAKLNTLIESPRLLLTEDVLADADRLLDEAMAIGEAGPRLIEQRDQLALLVRLASTPIPVTLVSDGFTEVTVYRVDELGTFTELEVSLKPGSYTAVGQRIGFRDVRETFEVLPGTDNGPVTIICDEAI